MMRFREGSADGSRGRVYRTCAIGPQEAYDAHAGGPNREFRFYEGGVMNATSLGTIVKKSVGWSIWLSVLMILAGFLAIAVPQAAGILWELLVGILYVFVGCYLLFRPVAGLASLTLALAIYLFAEGVLELILSFRLRPMPSSGWLLFDGIITLILAVMIWRTWPSSTEWVIGTLVGISMLFSGISRLMLSLAARRLVDKLA